MAATFCTHCGANLLPENKFCANCGQSVYAAPAAIQRSDYVDLSDYVTKPAAQSAYRQSVYEQSQAATPPTPTSVVSPTPRQVQAPVYYTNRKEPGIAAILSLFWAGLGQIYNGQLLKGIGFIILYERPRYVPLQELHKAGTSGSNVSGYNASPTRASRMSRNSSAVATRND